MLAMLDARIEFQLCALFCHPYAENFPCVQNTVIHLCLPASWNKNTGLGKKIKQTPRKM